MPTQVTIQVQNSSSQIIGLLPKLCVDQIKFATSYQVVGANFSQAFKRGFWDGRKNLFDAKTQIFPTGLLSKVRAILTQNSVPHVVQDLRRKPRSTLSFNLDPNLQFRPYQLDAINLAPQKQRGILRLATAAGKSVLAAGVIAQLKVPTLILVHKKDLLWQLVDTLEKALGIPVGKIGAGVVDPKDITVGMIQTTSRLFDPKIKTDREDNTEIEDPEGVREFIQKVQCVIADECHHINEGQYSTVLSQCADAFYRFGLSATPFRSDQADLVIEAHTGPKFVDVSASYLIDHGYLAAPTIYMYQFRHKRQPADLTYSELYAAEIEQNCTRNAEIVKIVQSAVNANKSVLVAVTRIKHGELLQDLLQPIEPTTIFAHGKLDSLVRRDILKELNEGKRKVVISTTVFGEGVDVPNLEVLVNAKAADSNIDSMQLAGRVLRVTPKKTKATIIDIADEGCRHLSDHTESRRAIYRTEPRYITKEVSTVEEIQF